MKKKIAICYSGGMDSRIMLHLAEKQNPTAEVTAIYWSHGHKQDVDERRHLPRMVEVRRCDWLNLNVAGGLHGKQDANAPIYIPGRNLAFAVLTACQEMPDEVWIGALANEQHPLSTDKNALFCYMASATISYALSPFLPAGVQVRCPLAERGWDKGVAATWAVSNGLPVSELARSWSCRGDHMLGTDLLRPCGNCDQCIRRFAIFFGMNRSDAEQYAYPILYPGAGRDWLVRLYEAAAASKWKGPEAADCTPFMANLADFICDHRRDDADLIRVAYWMRGTYK